jgi:hypothetical protein
MGYIDYKWSERAQAAKNDGLLTSTQAAKALGVSAKAIREVLEADEWHHTSAKFNKTKFYDLSKYTTENFEFNELEKIADRLIALSITPQYERKVMVKVLYYEWGGTRHHPQRFEYNYRGEAIIRGNWIFFDGMKKKLSGKNLIVKKENIGAI